MKTNWNPGLVVLILLTWAGPSHGGGITSANAPEAPPLPKIPGTARLTCDLMVGEMRDFYTPKDGSHAEFTSRTTTLEYAKAEGESFFSCIEGCENPVWKTFKHDLPEAPRLPLLKGRSLADTSFPFLEIRMINGTPRLRIQIETAHHGAAGMVVKGRNNADQALDEREIYAEARTQEYLDRDTAELEREYRRTRKPVVTQISGYTELRCRRLSPGEMSKTEAAAAYERPAAPGTISAAEYEKATRLHPLNQSYSQVLDLARKLDPNHRKAKLSEMARLWGSLDFLKALVPQMKEIVRTHPRMTVENAWAAVAQLLKIEPMSPSGIVAPTVMPLLIAESELSN